MRTDPLLPEVFSRSDALAAGLTRHQITARLNSRRWIALRRGAFCLAETFNGYAPNQRHVLHAVASRLVHRNLDLVESHLTAAARWGLPMPLGEGWRAYLTDGCTSRSTRLDEHAVIEVATLWPADKSIRNGVPLTAPARTAADCLRHYDAEVAVAIVDAAIRQGLTSTEAVRHVLRLQERWPLGLRGQMSFEYVDGRRESWLESISAVRLCRTGVPMAEPQVEILDVSNRLVGRTDFLWEDCATVGEADGAAKYSLGDWADLSSASAKELVDARVEAAVRTVRQEKAREDALRDLGLEVVRWTTTEILRDLAGVRRRVMAARSRGEPARFTGRLRLSPQLP